MDDSQYIRCFGYMILCYLHHHPGKCLINKDTVRAQILPQITQLVRVELVPA